MLKNLQYHLKILFKGLHLKAKRFYPQTQRLETPYVRDSLIHSLEVKGLVYRHLGLVNVLYMFFLQLSPKILTSKLKFRNVNLLRNFFLIQSSQLCQVETKARPVCLCFVTWEAFISLGRVRNILRVGDRSKPILVFDICCFD